MAEYPMTEIVARREFDFVGPNGPAKVFASIGKPAIMPDAPDSDWYCPFLIEGPDRHWERFAVGVDAMQALLMALSALRSYLEYIARSGKLTFLEHEDISIALVGGVA